MTRHFLGGFSWAVATLAVGSTLATPGEVVSHVKISETAGGFTGALDNTDFFGMSVAWLGDLDGDTVAELAVAAPLDDDGPGFGLGAVWVLFLNADGTVREHQKISDSSGGFQGDLDDSDNFGIALAALGDLNGDGVDDLAVGASGDDDGGRERGAVWILFLEPTGRVDSFEKISDKAGGFTGVLSDDDRFGGGVATLGDLDGDDVVDLAVGIGRDDDGGPQRGAVWILFLNADGTVKSHQKISDTTGGFTGELDDDDHFGSSVAALGDLDNDGVLELAAGAVRDDDGGQEHGAVWVLFLNDDGTVKSHQKISSTEGGFSGVLEDDAFGGSMAAVGDLDDDGVGDLAVGALFDDDGGAQRGAVWVLFLNDDGTVKSHQKISTTEGNFTGALDDNDRFGGSLAARRPQGGPADELAVGAIFDDDGGSNNDANIGAVWVLKFDEAAACPWDLDASTVVWREDIITLFLAWGPNPGHAADFNGDGRVGIRDFFELFMNWGPCP